MKSSLLKLVRQALGLTQKEIAALISVSDKTWSQWESGNNSIHPAFITFLDQQLAKHYGVDLQSFIKASEKLPSLSLKDIQQRPDELAEQTHQQEYSQPTRAFKFIDLFAGIGGVRQAFEQAGGRCVFSSEIDVHAKYTYYKNFNVVPFGDITKIDANDIPEHDLLCAGFPCQPFSHIGKREGFNHPTQGTMFHEIVRILEVRKPRAIFLENVPGLINHDDGNTLAVILKSLADLGYQTYFKTLDASQFGVPQKRQRFYLVGMLENNDFSFPTPPMIEANIGDFIESHDTGYCISKHLQQSYIFKKDDGRPQIVDKSTQGAVKTLVSSYHKIQRLTGTFVRDGETGLRLLSENECKAIMGFPQDFNLPVSRTQMYRQLGNSVVVPVIAAIAKEVAEAIASTPQKKLAL